MRLVVKNSVSQITNLIYSHSRQLFWFASFVEDSEKPSQAIVAISDGGDSRIYYSIMYTKNRSSIQPQFVRLNWFYSAPSNSFFASMTDFLSSG